MSGLDLKLSTTGMEYSYFQPVYDPKRSFFIIQSHIPCSKPTACQHRNPRCLFVSPIPWTGIGSAEVKLTSFIWSDFSAILVQKLSFAIGYEDSYASSRIFNRP